MRCAARFNPSWTRSIPWVLLGLRNAPRLDTSTSTAEIVFGTAQRIPGMCFLSEQARACSAAEHLALSRSNVEKHSPRALDLTKFKSSPFIMKALRTSNFVYIRDDRLGKPSLAPRYTGPFKVKEKLWDSNTFVVDLGNREDHVSLSRLKAASVPPEST